MSHQSLAYLVTEQGALVQLKSHSILQNFKSHNLLVFYAFQSKILYNWIGRRADVHTVENIDNTEQLIMGMHPGKTILRHITIYEQNRDGIEEFLKDIGISLEDYKERLSLWREFEISVYSDIQKFKIEENNNLILDKFVEAMDSANHIRLLAEKIHDSALVKEKIHFIENLQEKKKLIDKKNTILSEINKLIPELKNSIISHNIEAAVSLYNQITLMYKKINQEPAKENKAVIDEYLKFYEEWESRISIL